LAGELSPADRAAVESRAAADAGFRSALEAQREVEAALRAAYEAPVMSSPARRPAARRQPWFPLAAAVAVLGAGVAAYVMWPVSEDGPKTPEQVYATILKGGFKPPIVCPNDPVEFARLVKGKLGVALTPSLPAGSGVTLAGWGYGNSWGSPMSEGTMILLATRGDAKVVVFIDRKRNDRTLRDPGGGKHLFRKEAGDLVLYEISPLDEPIILPALEAR
jgi:hypothetical protein